MDTKYKVEKLVNGEWCYYDTYSSAKAACYACFMLGKYDVDDVRVTPVNGEE